MEIIIALCLFVWFLGLIWGIDTVCRHDGAPNTALRWFLLAVVCAFWPVALLLGLMLEVMERYTASRIKRG